MTCFELEEYLQSRGYSLHSYSAKDRRNSTWSKFFDAERNPCSVNKAFFSISLFTTPEQDTPDSPIKYELLYVTERRMFQFRSGEMSPITRNDFDKIEGDFVYYSYYLQRYNPF